MSNPSDNVHITKVDKRGDWVSVDGVVNGKKVHVDIPAPSVAQGGEKLMKRSLYGTAISDPRE